jgi:hypothetical protein
MNLQKAGQEGMSSPHLGHDSVSRELESSQVLKGPLSRDNPISFCVVTDIEQATKDMYRGTEAIETKRGKSNLEKRSGNSLLSPPYNVAQWEFRLWGQCFLNTGTIIRPSNDV